MKDRVQVETLASRELRDGVYLIEEISLQGFSLSIWRQANIKPARSAAIFELDNKLVVTTRSFKHFEKLLGMLKPSQKNKTLIFNLIEKAAPPRRTVLIDPNHPDLLPKYRGVWKPPAWEKGELVFFCNDYRRGKFEKIIIRENYQLDVVELGPGKRFMLK